MLKVYFDGSGKEEDPQTKFVTIAGFAGEEEVWSYFDQEWNGILSDRGNPPYMHMADAIQHKRNFESWDADKTDFLIQGLIGLLQEVTVGQKKFCGFSCTVDLAAHSKWKARNHIPPIAQLCANLSFAKTFDWYGGFPDLIISSFDIFFDRGDPFLNVLMQQRNDRRIKKEHPWWDLVRTIEPAEMQKTPALQAADLLAWSHNRLKSNGPSGWAGRLASQIAGSVQFWHFDLTAEILASQKHRNEYGFYT